MLPAACCGAALAPMEPSLRVARIRPARLAANLLLVQVLDIAVQDNQLTGRPEVGRVSIPLARIPEDGRMTAWLPLQVSWPYALLLPGMHAHALTLVAHCAHAAALPAAGCQAHESSRGACVRSFPAHIWLCCWGFQCCAALSRRQG